MKIEVSKIMKLLTMPLERKFPGILCHKVLELFQSDDLLQGEVHRFGSALDPQDVCRFVGQLGIQPD